MFRPERAPSKKRTSWKKNMAAIYKYCDNTKVVVSLRGAEAIQHMSDASIRNYGLRMLQNMAEDAEKMMSSGEFVAAAAETSSTRDATAAETSSTRDATVAETSSTRDAAVPETSSTRGAAAAATSSTRDAGAAATSSTRDSAGAGASSTRDTARAGASSKHKGRHSDQPSNTTKQGALEEKRGETSAAREVEGREHAGGSSDSDIEIR